MLESEPTDPIEQYELSLRYKKDSYNNESQNLALYWCTKAAEQGHSQAQYDMAMKFYYGIGGVKNYKQAVFWVKKSATQDYPEAENLLALMYKKGDALEKNNKKALYWYERSAISGCADASYALGHIFKNGDFEVTDLYQSAFWFNRAIKQDGNYHSRAYLLAIKKQLMDTSFIDKIMNASRVLEIIQEVRQKLNKSDINMTKQELCAAQNTLHELHRYVVVEGEKNGELEESYETCDGPCWPDYPKEILKSPDEWGDREPEPEFHPILIKLLSELGFKEQTHKFLKKMNLIYIADLVQFNEVQLLKSPFAGKEIIVDIRKVLASNELALGIKLENWPPQSLIDKGIYKINKI